MNARVSVRCFPTASTTSPSSVCSPTAKGRVSTVKAFAAGEVGHWTTAEQLCSPSPPAMTSPSSLTCQDLTPERTSLISAVTV
jgi:hypothetical protein